MSFVTCIVHFTTDYMGKIIKEDIVMHTIHVRQRLGKHCLKAGIAAEAEVNLLGNGNEY
jgi:hypothetical protein